MSFLLDTTVIIDAMREHGPAVEFLTNLERVPVCSEMTRVEVMKGLRSAERSTAERWFKIMRWAVVDEAIARRAGELGRRWRRSHPGIGTVDLVVAASAQHLDLNVATTNVRHFPMFRGLRPPYSA